MPNIQLFAPIDRKSADTILFFEESRVFIVPLFFQKLLINAELSLCSVPYQNSVNVLLGDSKSGGLFILRRLNCRFLFFFRGEGVTQLAYTISASAISSAAALILFIRPTHFI